LTQTTPTDVYQWDHPPGQLSQGSILLVHGTAPVNIDGIIPGCTPKYPLGMMPTYRELSEVLTGGGWSTLRYTRPGISQDSVDWDQYMKVDHDAIIDQLNRLFQLMPREKPRVVFCWSGGSLHVPHLPLSEAQALIIVGGISTNRFHNGAMMAGARHANQAAQANQAVQAAPVLRWQETIAEVEAFADMTYEEIAAINKPNGDGPLIRFWQECRLKDNWTYFQKFVELPILVLQGAEDAEVHATQARLWQQLLPYHKITLVEKPDGDHFLGINNQNGAANVGAEILRWLAEVLR